jgi:F-type H+-transporting ATPase subunit gamma
MGQMRNLKKRIASVNTTGHIAQGMKLVSTAKLKTAQDRVFSARPFARYIAQVMNDLAILGGVHPLFQQREIKRQAVFVFTADRGLCGNFNDEIVRYAVEFMGKLEAVDVIAVGREGARELKKAGIEPVSTLLDYTSHPSFGKAKSLAQMIQDAYSREQWQRVDLVYAKFYTVLNQKPRNFELLPIEPQKETKRQLLAPGECIYEPDPGAILDHLALRYLETELYRALLETQVGEHGARVAAMDAASDNARELTGKLTRQYNRARQSAITTELAEITGGAESLVHGALGKGVVER